MGSHSLLQGIFPTQGSNPGIAGGFLTIWATREVSDNVLSSTYNTNLYNPEYSPNTPVFGSLKYPTGPSGSFYPRLLLSLHQTQFFLIFNFKKLIRNKKPWCCQALLIALLSPTQGNQEIQNQTWLSALALCKFCQSMSHLLWPCFNELPNFSWPYIFWRITSCSHLKANSGDFLLLMVWKLTVPYSHSENTILLRWPWKWNQLFSPFPAIWLGTGPRFYLVLRKIWLHYQTKLGSIHPTYNNANIQHIYNIWHVTTGLWGRKV